MEKKVVGCKEVKLAEINSTSVHIVNLKKIAHIISIVL